MLVGDEADEAAVEGRVEAVGECAMMEDASEGISWVVMVL